MSEFTKFEHLYYWGSSVSVDAKNGSIYFTASRWVKEPLTDCTREEFCEAAKKAIAKIKKNTGIDLGTDWLPKWEPKPGEVVYCWDNGDRLLNIAPFKRHEADKIFSYVVNDVGYQNIAPLSEGIPEPFKSQWEEAAK